MMISVLIGRDLAQNMTAAASWWAVGHESTPMLRVTARCHGPMDAKSALMLGIRALLAELERPTEGGGSAGRAADGGQQLDLPYGTRAIDV